MGRCSRAVFRFFWPRLPTRPPATGTGLDGLNHDCRRDWSFLALCASKFCCLLSMGVMM